MEVGWVTMALLPGRQVFFIIEPKIIFQVPCRREHRVRSCVSIGLLRCLQQFSAVEYSHVIRMLLSVPEPTLAETTLRSLLSVYADLEVNAG